MFSLLPIIFLFINHAFGNIELAQEKKWMRLLHYKPNLLSGFTSQADGQNFFLSPNGKTSPLEELKESLKRFSETTTPSDDHPICRFPLRFKWLNQQLGFPWKVDFSTCPTYLEFFSKVAARRASVIFSSYYLSNPNSAFGHTLLRLSRYEDSKETEMLDYGINFAADSQASNIFSYVAKGLWGGFKGRFTAIPYYYKVREYSDLEFRDLWAFDLKISQKEVIEMVDHIFELSHTHFDYYYFLENCSYHILSIIEVARLDKNLTDHFNWFAIPADTIRLLEEEGLVDLGKRRESTYGRLMRLSDDLSRSELKLAKNLSLAPSLASPSHSDSVLDVAIEAFDYKNAKLMLIDDSRTKELKEPLLLARALNPVIGRKSDQTSQTDSPAYSHSPSRVSFSQGYRSHQGRESRIELRASLHDWLDPLSGTLKEAELIFGQLELNYKEASYQHSQLIVEDLTIMKIRNFPRQSFWVSPLSWELDLGLKQLQEDSCRDCPAPRLKTSLGNTLHLNQGAIFLAFLMTGEVSLHSFFVDHYRLGVGPRLVARWLPHEKWVIGLAAESLLQTYQNKAIGQENDELLEAELRFHAGKSWSLYMRQQTLERTKQWINRFDLGLRTFF
jgi:hypothetical protein